MEIAASFSRFEKATVHDLHYLRPPKTRNSLSEYQSCLNIAIKGNKCYPLKARGVTHVLSLALLLLHLVRIELDLCKLELRGLEAPPSVPVLPALVHEVLLTVAPPSTTSTPSILDIRSHSASSFSTLSLMSSSVVDSPKCLLLLSLKFLKFNRKFI